MTLNDKKSLLLEIFNLSRDPDYKQTHLPYQCFHFASVPIYTIRCICILKSLNAYAYKKQTELICSKSYTIMYMHMYVLLSYTIIICYLIYIIFSLSLHGIYVRVSSHVLRKHRIAFKNPVVRKTCNIS